MWNFANFWEGLYSLHRQVWDEFKWHLSFLKDHENGHTTNHREYYVSGDIDLLDMSKKARSFGVSINDLFVGAISVAVHKVTQGRECQPINIVMPISTGDQIDDFKNFKPANHVVVTFSSIPINSDFQSACQASRQAMSRYRNSNVLTLWMLM